MFSRNFPTLFYTFFLFSILNPLSAQVDVAALSLINPPSMVVCKNTIDPVIVGFKSTNTNPIDLWTTPLKVTVTISGAKSGVLTGEMTSGVIYTTENFKIGASSNPAFAFDVPGDYVFKIKLSLEGDINLANNEITVTRTVRPPLSIPFFEDVNSPDMEEWRFDENPQYQCFTSGIADDNGNKYVTCSQGDCGYSIFTMPLMGKILQGDFLSFDYRILKNYLGNGSVEPATDGFNYIQIQASTDCGNTFETFYTLTAAEHVATDIFIKKTVALNKFVGKDIKIRFLMNTNGGDFLNKILLQFDNFSVGTGIGRDAGVIRLENLVGQCDNATQEVKVKIKNYGVETINFALTPTLVTAKITGGTTATLTKNLNTGTLAPQGVMDVTLDGFFNMSALNSAYNLAIFTNLPNDAVVKNDTLKRVVTSPAVASPAARSLPYTENFDASTNVPAGWNTGFANFGQWTVSRGTGNGGNSLFKDVTSFIGENLTTPRIGAIRASDRLSFDVKISSKTNPNEIAIVDWGKCFVQVSTDCGYTYETILALNPDNLKTGTWSAFAAPLSKYGNQNILIKFQTAQSTPNPAYRIDIDNFSIATSPALDMSMVALLRPETSCTNGLQLVAVKIQNNAGVTIRFATNPVTVDATISGAINTTLSNIIDTGSLAAGETKDVSIGVFNMSNLGDYFIKPTVTVANDALRSNDSILTVKRTVRGQFDAPLFDNFDDQTSFPQGWLAGDWNTSHTTINNASGKYLSVAMAAKTTSEVYLPILKLITEDDFLTFRYKFGPIAGSEYLSTRGHVIFEASTDCGVNYTEFYAINKNTINSIDFGREWQDVKLPLSNFKGNPLSIRVKTVKTNAYNWLFALDDIKIGAIKPIDASCDTVFLNPIAPSSCGNSTRLLEVRITNRGTKDIDFSINPATITVKMSGQGSKTVTKRLTSNVLYANSTQDILVEDAVNTVDEGAYIFQASISTQGDIVLNNDTCKKVTVNVNPAFARLPYRQNFDTIGIPKGWVLDRWGLFDTEGVQNSRCAFFQVLDANFNEKPLTSPLIGKINDGDRLYFDYRVMTTEGGGTVAPAPVGWGYFKIFVSNVCGETYADVFTVSDNNHIVSSNFATKSVSLGAFKGDNVTIRIVPYFGNSPYTLMIDNVVIRRSETVDIAPATLVSTFYSCGLAEQGVSVEVRNVGSSTLRFNQNPLTVKAVISGRINETLTKNITTDTLAPDQILSITFDKKVNTLADGTYNLKIITDMIGDGNRNNDTIGNFTQTVGKTYPVPFSQDFDNITANPLNDWKTEGWTVKPLNNQSAGKVIFGTFDDEKTLTLPNLGTIRADDALDFDYYFGGAPVMQHVGRYNIEVQVSTDCGDYFASANFRTVFYNSSDDLNVGWRHFSAPLGDFAGKAIRIRFKIQGVNSYNSEIAFDNITLNNVRKKDVQPLNFFHIGYPPYCSDANAKWSASIANNGYEVIDFTVNPVTVTAVFRGETISTVSKEIKTGTLAPNTSFEILFDLDMSRLGVYYSTLFTTMAGDINRLNDTLRTDTLNTKGAVLPYFDDFEAIPTDYNFLRIGSQGNWIIADGFGNDGGRGLRSDFKADGPTGYIVSPQFSAIRAGDAFAFDIKLTSIAGQPLTSNWGNIKISVTTDCQKTYTEVYAIDGSTFRPTNWTRISVPLSNFVGKSIVIRLDFSHLTNSVGYFVHLDNIALKANIEAPVNDDCISAITLSQFPNGHQGTTEQASTSASNLPTCTLNPITDVWYKIVTPTDAIPLTRVNVSLQNLANGTVINYAVYKGTCTVIRQLDSLGLCSNTSISPTISLKNLEQGQTYFLRLWSNTVAQAGKFTVRLTTSTPFADLPIANSSATVCRPLSSIQIRAENNNVWVPIMDGNDIVAEIKANGNNMGRVQAEYFINKTGTIRKVGNTPYLDRSVGFKPDVQPQTPVSVRIYLTAAEWQALKRADPSINDSTFSLTRVTDQTCTNAFVATNASQITNGFLYPFNTGYFIQFNTPQFSQFFVSNKKATLGVTATIDNEPYKTQVYPVPTEGALTIEIEMTKAEDLKLELMDFTGRLLLSEKHTTVSGLNSFTLDLSNKPSGSYLLVLTTSRGKWVKKIIR